jgi:hypothetical protein
MNRRRAHPYPDSEIGYLQQCIYLRRLSLELSLLNARQALRKGLTSPGALLGTAATGFVLERLTRGQAVDRPGTANRLLSLFAEAARTGLKFAQSAPGLWVAARFASRGQQRAHQDS